MDSVAPRSLPPNVQAIKEAAVGYRLSPWTRKKIEEL
jgi:hypothetical protein